MKKTANFVQSQSDNDLEIGGSLDESLVKVTPVSNFQQSHETEKFFNLRRNHR